MGGLHQAAGIAKGACGVNGKPAFEPQSTGTETFPYSTPCVTVHFSITRYIEESEGVPHPTYPTVRVHAARFSEGEDFAAHLAANCSLTCSQGSAMWHGYNGAPLKLDWRTGGLLKWLRVNQLWADGNVPSHHHRWFMLIEQCPGIVQDGMTAH